jgi:putative ABC transport system permease protein
VFSLSLGMGLRAFVDNEFKSRDDFWRINVRTSDPAPDESTIPPDLIEVHGTFSPERKARIRESLVEKHLNSGTLKAGSTLTPEKIAEIKALPDVTEVRTFRSQEGRLWVGDKTAIAFVASGNLSGVTDRLTAGRLPGEQADELLVSEFTLYDLGLRSDAEFEAVVGKKVALEVGGVRNTPSMTLAHALTGRFATGEMTKDQNAALEKLTAALPKAIEVFDLTPGERAGLKALIAAKPKTVELPWQSGEVSRGDFTVSGVVRANTREEEKRANPMAAWELRRGNVLLPTEPGERLFTKLTWAKEYGFPMAEVRVKPGGDMPGLVAAIEKMGYSTYSSLRWFNNAKREVTMIAGGLNLVALIALFVAGIGITNTLVTTVVERTREIGILKAVGATRGQVQGIFLAEGAHARDEVALALRTGSLQGVDQA